MFCFGVAVRMTMVPKIAAGRSQALVGIHAFQPLSGFFRVSHILVRWSHIGYGCQTMGMIVVNGGEEDHSYIHCSRNTFLFATTQKSFFLCSFQAAEPSSRKVQTLLLVAAQLKNGPCHLTFGQNTLYILQLRYHRPSRVFYILEFAIR
jgi:hypothetical protein